MTAKFESFMSDKIVSDSDKCSTRIVRSTLERRYVVIHIFMVLIYVLFAFVADGEVNLAVLLVVKYASILLLSIYILDKLTEDGFNGLMAYLDYCNRSMLKKLNLASKLSLVGFGLWFVAILFKKNAVIMLTFIPIALFFFAWSSLVYLEKYNIVSELKKYKSTSLMLLLLGAIFFYCSNVFTVKEIEYITGVNASYFEYTRALVVFFCGYLLFSFTVFIVANLFMFNDFFHNLLSRYKGKIEPKESSSYKREDGHSKWPSFILTILPIITMGFFALPLVLNSESRRAKISDLVESLDMIQNPICDNKQIQDGDKKYPLIYLGGNADVVLFKKDNNYYIGHCTLNKL